MSGCRIRNISKVICKKNISGGYYPSFGNCRSAPGTRINPFLLTCGRSVAVVEASKEAKLRRGK